jgi:hypothetical protein
LLELEGLLIHSLRCTDAIMRFYSLTRKSLTYSLLLHSLINLTHSHTRLHSFTRKEAVTFHRVNNPELDLSRGFLSLPSRIPLGKTIGLSHCHTASLSDFQIVIPPNCRTCTLSSCIRWTNNANNTATTHTHFHSRTRSLTFTPARSHSPHFRTRLDSCMRSLTDSLVSTHSLSLPHTFIHLIQFLSIMKIVSY